VEGRVGCHRAEDGLWITLCLNRRYWCGDGEWKWGSSRLSRFCPKSKSFGNGIVVPALAKIARTGHPQFRSGKKRGNDKGRAARLTVRSDLARAGSLHLPSVPWRNAHPFPALVLDLDELDVYERLDKHEEVATKFV